MAHKWTQAQRDALSRKMKAVKAAKVTTINVAHAKRKASPEKPLVRLATRLIRMLPDDKLVSLVKAS